MAGRFSQIYTDNMVIDKFENPDNLRSSVSKKGNSYTIKLFDNGQTTFTKALSFALHEQERSE